MIEIPRRAMIVTPHPDDAEIACGGMVARWVNEGTEVFYVLCSDGGKGTDDLSMTTENLIQIRKQEQRDAAAVLGVKEVVALGYPDGELEDTRDFLREMVRAIRRFRPEVVSCPDPYRRSFYFHRDHRITGQVTQDAVFPYARDRLHFPELEEEGLDPHKVGTILFWGPEEVDTFVDITDTMELKIKSLLCHRSQISLDEETGELGWLKKWCKEVGDKAGVQYAEGFRKVQFNT